MADQFLGKTFRDKITGFSGVATGHVRYITGCDQLLLAPKAKESGDVVESRWFDVQRCEVDATAPRIELDNGSTPGSDKPAPRR